MPAEMVRSDGETDETGVEEDEEIEDADAHLAGIEDGAGCTEIWEHLSRRRSGDDD